MQLFHLYHSHRFHALAHSKFWLFEFSIWLHVLARSLIAIFVPVLLVRMGFPIGEVMLYYALYCLFDVPLNFAARAVVRKWGARWAIIAGNVAVIGFFSGFYHLTGGAWHLLILLAFLAAAYDALYWVGHLYLFMKYEGARDNTERDTGILYSVKRVAAIVGPGIGALILIFFDQRALIVMSIALFAASLWPLFKMEEGVHETLPRERRLSFKEFFQDIRERKDYGSIALYSLHGSAETVLWPIFIFVIFGTIESVAYLPIIISATAIIFTYFAGNISREKRERAIMLGAILIALTWLLRLLVGNPILYYGSVFLMGLFSILVSVPLDSNIIDRAKERDDMLSASTYRNAVSMATKMLFYIALAVLVSVFQVSFLVAALAMFGLVLLNFFFVRFQRALVTGSADVVS